MPYGIDAEPLSATAARSVLLALRPAALLVRDGELVRFCGVEHRFCALGALG